MGNGTTLPIKVLRNSYIKYLEQGLAIALSLYRMASAINCKMSFGSRIIGNDEQTSAVIVFEARLPCAPTAFKSGKLFDSLAVTVRTNQFPPSVVPVITDSIIYPIPEEPSTVNTHEKYILWLAQTIQSLGEERNDNDLCKVTFDALAPIPVIVINASLPYDEIKLKSTGNLFESIKQFLSIPSESGGGGSSGGGGYC